MKRNLFTTITCGLVVLAAACVLPGTAMANTTVDMALDGVGTFNPFIIPSSVNNSYLNNMITVYNGGTATADGETYTKMQGSLTPNAPLPASPGLGGNVSVLNGPLTFTIDLGAGGAGNYLVAGWDGPQGAHAVYYIGGLTGKIDLVNDVPGFEAKGLSNYWLSDSAPSVPDGGATIALLGFGLVGLESMRRRMAK
jgi:hypothetical protein